MDMDWHGHGHGMDTNGHEDKQANRRLDGISESEYTGWQAWHARSTLLVMQKKSRTARCSITYDN